MFDKIDTSYLLGIIGIVATFLTSILFYWLGKRFTQKNLYTIEKEKKLRAKEEIISILENYIINNFDINKEMTLQRITAIERKESINISNNITPISLLQDVALRLDTTQYLSIEQKKSFSNKITELIKSFNEDSIPYSHPFLKLLSSLENKLKNNEVESALEELTNAKEKEPREIDEYENLKNRISHLNFSRTGLFFWFWAYNGMIGFAPLLFPNFVETYHWWIFGLGILLASSYLVSPFYMPKFFNLKKLPSKRFNPTA